MTKDPQSALAAATDEIVGAASKKAAEGVTNERVPAPPLAPIRNQWLNDLTIRIRSRPIPWEGYQRADLVSAEELKLIKKVDAKGGVASGRGSDVAKISDSDASEYALLYLRLLAKLSRTDTLQQILVLVGDVLQDRDDRAQHFLDTQSSAPAAIAEGGSASQNLPWGPFLKLLDAQDEFVQLKSAQFLILLLLNDHNERAPPFALSRVTSFLSQIIHPSTTTSSASIVGYAEGQGAEIGIQLLEALLRSPKYRTSIWEEELQIIAAEPNGQSEGQIAEVHEQLIKTRPQRVSFVNGLLDILRTSISSSGSAPGSGAASGSATPNGGASSLGARTPTAAVGPQMQYQAIFCLWLFSFDKAIAEEFNVKFPAVPLLVEVARSAIKEKVIRVVVATFRNLLVQAPEINGKALLGAKVLNLSESLATRNWSDEEVGEDLKVLIDELKHRLKGMSTYDVYVSELASGQLSWDNPLHELDEFWRENTPKLLEDQQAQLNKLIEIIMESKDTTTLAVACNDLGRVVTVSETAKRKVNESPVKVRIMDLMSHPNSDIKFRALNTVSKLVSASWR